MLATCGKSNIIFVTMTDVHRW